MGGWALETSLDVEYAHAMAPGANILLVETPVSETEGARVSRRSSRRRTTSIDHHLGDVISQSFGATEQTFPSPFSRSSVLAARSSTPRQHRVTVLGASGDGGATDDSAYDRQPERQLLPVPGRQLAFQRSARDLGRRHATAPRRQRQPHGARQRLERHRAVRRPRGRGRRPLGGVLAGRSSRTTSQASSGARRGTPDIQHVRRG